MQAQLVSLGLMRRNARHLWICALSKKKKMKMTSWQKKTDKVNRRLNCRIVGLILLRLLWSSSDTDDDDNDW